MERDKIIEVLKRRIQNLIVSDLTSPLWWEDFADELQAKEVTDLEIEIWAAGRVNKIDPNKYGYGDLLIEGAKWYREQIKQL